MIGTKDYIYIYISDERLWRFLGPCALSPVLCKLLNHWKGIALAALCLNVCGASIEEFQWLRLIARRHLLTHQLSRS